MTTGEKAPGGRALGAAAAFWLMAALIGQWAFFAYIAAFYGPSTLSGEYEIWNRLEAFGVRPYRPGDTAGNIAFLGHALGAGLIALGGALQLMPFIRNRFPAFHRWNGRVFLVTVVALSLTGFYMVWLRNEPPDSFNDLSTSVNGLLILSFAGLALRAAMKRDIAVHRRWAMRLYLVSNAQWFLRIGVFSYFASASALGLRPSFSDPFFEFWTWGCFLVPLAVLQFYLFVQDRGGAALRIAAAFGLVALTLLMAVGIFAFAIFSRALIAGEPLGF